MTTLPDPWRQPTMCPSEVAPLLGMAADSVRLGCQDGSIPSIAGPRATHIRRWPRSQSYRVPTTWVYSELGLPLPEREAS